MALPSLEQSFYTRPVANERVALYTLTIRAPDAVFSSVSSYTFPLSPQMVRKEPFSLVSLHDVQGPAQNSGVIRQADQFGMTPPIITIEGTTGWRSHSTDGYIWNGLNSIQQVVLLLNKFSKLNQQQLAAKNPRLYRLEFYDYFMSDFFEVVPIGPQGVRQTAHNTLLSYYQFRFAAIRNVTTPLGQIVDTVAAKLFGVGALSAINGASQVCGLVGSY